MIETLLDRIETPCFVVDKALLRKNLAILDSVRKRADVKILLAQKAFSMYAVYPLLAAAGRIPAFTAFVNERKGGEFKSSMVLALTTMACAIAICWGLLNEKLLVLACVYAWGVGDAFDALIGKTLRQPLTDDVELLDGAGYEFDTEKVRRGQLSPVFFGSALNNFGVEELLNCFVKIAPSPRPVQAVERMVSPEDSRVTGFIFKITAP